MMIKTRQFYCDHPFTPENQVKIGRYNGMQRVGCKTCRSDWKARTRGRKFNPNLEAVRHIDPDSLLRKF